MSMSIAVAYAARRFLQEAVYEYGLSRQQAIAQLRSIYRQGRDFAERELLANYPS